MFGGKKPPKAPRDLPATALSVPKPPVLPRPTARFETVIGTNTTLIGELRCQSDVRIDGTFEGTLEIEGNVLVGETGKVNADIHAKNVSVAGRVRGDISGKKVELLRTAWVWGNINATAITTEDGAFIDGRLTMMQHNASPQQLDMNSLTTAESSKADEELELVEGETIDNS